MPPLRSPGRRLPLWKKLVFACVPLCALFLLGEIVARALREPFWFGSYRALRVDQVQRGYPAVRDSELGYVTRPGADGVGNRWGTRLRIDADGFRSNGAPVPAGGKPIVAVGDSFTFGDQVSDDETWPAYLEQILQRPVKNGGVFGYSLAQAVLRAERILGTVPAEWLVVSLIPDDINRCELAKRYAPLPYFEVVDGSLQLRNVPVQDTSDPEEMRSRAFKDFLGRSALIDAVLANVVNRWWIVDQKEVRAHPPGKGAEIALLLVDRIADFCEKRSCRVMFLLQGERGTEAATAVLARARSRGLAALDLIARVEEEERADPSVRARYFRGHMTAAGNRWVAEQVAEVIAAVR
ncbi:MAG: hypothetical protein R3F56_10430 [Planctomycetota bacterium]